MREVPWHESQQAEWLGPHPGYRALDSNPEPRLRILWRLYTLARPRPQIGDISSPISALAGALDATSSAGLGNFTFRVGEEG